MQSASEAGEASQNREVAHAFAAAPADGRSAASDVQRVPVEIEGRTWLVERDADLETLWERLGEDEFGGDERIPYWAEIWPATVMLGRWLLRNPGLVRGKRCLDVGCGLGLSAIVGAAVGARVTAFDYALPGLRFARSSSWLNGVEPPLFAQMDWRSPAVRPHSFDRIWAGDVFYERRFFEPLEALFRHALAPGGCIWLGDPDRTVSGDVRERLEARGWRVRRIETDKIALLGQNLTVHLWEVAADRASFS